MARFWRAAIIGTYGTGVWTGESAQMGISGVGIEGGGDFDPRINQALPTFGAYASGEYLEDATFSIYAGSVGDGCWTLTKQKDLATALVAYATGVKSYQHTSFAWRRVITGAFEQVGGKWKVVNGSTVFELKTPVAGTSSNFTDGPDRAVVASFRTGGRGPRNRGRLYVPTPGASTSGTDGLCGSTIRNTVGNATRSLHDTVNTIGGLTHCVVSPTWTTYSAITSVEVGDEFDRQRRRRKGRPESYYRF